MKSGIELIAQEREEQITKHGRTVDRDVEQNRNFQLADAASALSSPIPEELQAVLDSNAETPPLDWDKNTWRKMMKKPYIDRLIIAGALIAAEIDRLHLERKDLFIKILEEQKQAA